MIAPLILAGCGHTHDGGTHTHGDETHQHDSPEGDAGEEAESLSDTVWNDRFELFMEHPPIRAGERVDFLVHLTILEGSRPVTEGPVNFSFARRGQALRSISAEAPVRPGIFSIEASFDSPGPLTMTIEIRGGPVQGEVEASPLTVHAADASTDQMAQEPAGQEGTITFLKEQQWTLDFSTAVAAPRKLQASVTAPAEVTAPSGRDNTVFSPAGGVYRRPPEGVPRLGESVSEGQLLGWVELTPEQRSSIAGAQVQAGQSLVRMRNELAQAEGAVAQERSRLATAQREVERLERLLSLEAVPRKRLEEAKSRMEIIEAALQVAIATRDNLQAQLSRHIARSSLMEELEQRIPLRAAASGKIVHSAAADGQVVDSRQELFRIIDLRRAWVKAEVSESEIGRLNDLQGAWLDLPGGGELQIAAEKLVDVGSVVDAASRTVPVIWELPNRDGLLKAGMLVQIHMRTGEEREAAVAVPREAVLVEEDKSVVYEQVTGESFSRRIVRTGAEDREWVEILEGFEAGRRVVVQGAYEVALAARSGDASAAHGHAH